MKPLFSTIHSVIWLSLGLCNPAFAQKSKEAAPKDNKSPAAASSDSEKPATPDAKKPSPAFSAAMEAAEKGDLAKALKILTEEANKGTVDAILAVADFHLSGRGTKASAKTAVEWYEKAAQSGNAVAHFRLAQIFLNGAEGVPTDQDRGKFALTAAMEAGLPEAIFTMGTIEEANARKADAEPDRIRLFTEARKHYEKAAAQEHPAALLAMSRFFQDGLGGEANQQKAAEYCRKAAMAGNVVALNEWGVRLQRGSGVPQDPVGAIGWLLAAAEAGLPAAMVNLGNVYEVGNGLPKNLEQAGAWYARGAKEGFAPAQLLLGKFFENGLGTKKNLAYAFTNYSRAANTGMQEAIAARDAIKPKLSAEELKEAQNLMKNDGPPPK